MCACPTGETALREVACHPGAAGIVALDDDGNVILVRQHRIAVGRLTLEIPAGKLDGADEDPFVCAQRELSEETGLTADHWRKLTVLETTPGFCNERIHLYLATGLHAGKTHPDEDEFVCTLRMPLSDAVQKVMDGTFRDGQDRAGAPDGTAAAVRPLQTINVRNARSVPSTLIVTNISSKCNRVDGFLRVFSENFADGGALWLEKSSVIPCMFSFCC